MYGAASTPANQYGSGAAQAWAAGNIGNGSVYVGIIDEGVMPHADLGANVWTNPGEIRRQRDRRRRQRLRGRCARLGLRRQQQHAPTTARRTITARTSPARSAPSAAMRVGVAGVNWNVTMIPAKFLGRRGGTTANAVKALDYLTDLKTRYGMNLVATNNSWGGGGFSQALLDAIKRGGKAGILFIAAAGNGGSDGVGDNNDTTASYPSNYVCQSTSTADCVIAVAAITSTGDKASVLELRRDDGRSRRARRGDLLDGPRQGRRVRRTRRTAAPRWRRRT